MSVQSLVRIGVLGALSWVLMYFADFKLPMFPTFLKVDPGDAPALLATFSMGTGAGLWTELIKVIIHFIYRGGNLLGHAGNLLAGASFVLGAGAVYRRDGGPGRSILAVVAGVAAVVLVMIPANALVFLPARGIAGSAAWDMSIQVLAPFNLVKFGLAGALGHALSVRIMPWVERWAGMSTRTSP